MLVPLLLAASTPSPAQSSQAQSGCAVPDLVSREDTVCVIGSSHSAVLVLMNLLEMHNGPKVVNLYRSPMKYAKFLSDGTIILDNTGLKVRL